MSSQKSTNVSFTLFFLFPLGALLSSLRNFKVPQAKNIAWLFIIFYGFTFVFSSVHSDSDRYKRELEYMAAQPSTTFTSFLSLIYSEDTSYVDVIQPLLTFTISRFTSDARILFAFFGLIFGYFYTRNLWFLLSYVESKIKPKAIPLIVLAALVIAVWQINGFRFWTAAHMFVYGLCLIAQGRRPRGLLISLSAVFMHFSFIIPMAILLIHLATGSRVIISTLLYFISFFVAQVRPESVSSYSQLLPKVFQERTKSYIGKEYLEFRLKENLQRNWYLSGRINAINYSINLLLLVILFKYRSLINAITPARYLLTFGLLLAAWANIFGGIPSVIRFQSVALMIIVFSLFIFVQLADEPVFSKWVYAPFVIASLLYVIVEVRVGMDSIGVLTLVGNPIISLFVSSETPLIDYIK